MITTPAEISLKSPQTASRRKLVASTPIDLLGLFAPFCLDLDSHPSFFSCAAKAGFVCRGQLLDTKTGCFEELETFRTRSENHTPRPNNRTSVISGESAAEIPTERLATAMRVTVTRPLCDPLAQIWFTSTILFYICSLFSSVGRAQGS